nr:hypothetical protein [Tanacetum cinerariifolium]
MGCWGSVWYCSGEVGYTGVSCGRGWVLGGKSGWGLLGFQGLAGRVLKNTCNNDKNLSEIKLEHAKEDELVVVVVKVVHELDSMMVVKEIEYELLEEIERSLDDGLSKTLVERVKMIVRRERVEVYYECKEPFKSLKCLWVRSKSIAVIWLEKVVTPLIDHAIKGFAAASVVLKPEHLKVDKHVCESSSTLKDCVLVRFID